MLRDAAAWCEWALLFALAVGCAIGLLVSRLTEPLDGVIHDAIVRMTPVPVDPRLLIVTIDEDSLRSVGPWPWRRDVHAGLLDELARAGAGPVVYDVLFLDPGPGDAELARAVAAPRRVALPLLIESPGPDGAPYSITRPVVPSRLTGHVVVRADRDGVFRQVELREAAGGVAVPHLVLAALGSGADDRTLIPFAGPAGSFPTVSASRVIAGEVPSELLRDRIVLVGATAAGLGDRFATPMGSERDLMPGIEVQANIANALLGSGLRREDRTLAGAIAVGALALLWLGFLRLGPRGNLVVALGLVLALVGLSVFLLTVMGIWTPPAAALFTLAVMFPLWGWRRLAAASRFLDAELVRLGGGEGAPGGDRISRQIALVSTASERMARLRGQRDETLAFLSHDLRQPAAAIVGLNPSDQRIAGHARRLLRLADQFVHGLRAEDAPLAPEPVELAALLDEAADQCWEAAQRVGGRVEVSCSWDIPELNIDRALIARAVVNLIDNALKYGGVASVARVRGWHGDGEIVITVADGGPGLDAAKASNLFRPYDRAGATRPDSVGLGLALVGTVVRRHEGQIVCISRADTGSLFEIRLPRR